MEVYYYVTAFIVGCVSALVCWILAQRKGRSPIGFAIVGFFLPLVGIIIAAVWPRAEGAS
jgi:hypothetical protein